MENDYRKLIDKINKIIDEKKLSDSFLEEALSTAVGRENQYRQLKRFLSTGNKKIEFRLLAYLIEFLEVDNGEVNKLLNINVDDYNFLDRSEIETVKNFKDLIEIKRKKKNYTIKKLISETDLTSYTYSKPKWDNISISVVVALCQLLCISYDELLWGLGIKKIYPKIQYNSLSTQKYLNNTPIDTLEECVVISFEEGKEIYLLSTNYLTQEIGVLFRNYIDEIYSLDRISTIKFYKVNGDRLNEIFRNIHKATCMRPEYLLEELLKLESLEEFSLLYALMNNIIELENTNGSR